MRRHTVLEDGLTAVEYDGWTVVLNYGAAEGAYQGRPVPSMDYIVVKEG